MMDRTFWMIRFNSRSLNSSSTKMKNYVKPFPTFNVTAISESWLDSEIEADVNLEGYELFTTNRVHKKGGGGGGAGLLVNCEVKCKKK